MEQLEMQPVEEGMAIGPDRKEPPRPDALSAESIMALVIDRLHVQLSMDITADGRGLMLKSRISDRLRPDYALVNMSEVFYIMPMGVQPQFRKDTQSPF